MFRTVRRGARVPKSHLPLDESERLMAGGAATAGQSVTSRALGVLDGFDTRHPPVALPEVPTRSGAPLTPTRRLLAELVAWGALSRRPDGRYEIGRKLWDL